MPAGSTLRFDLVPLDDFLACLMQHEGDVRLGYLPPAKALKEVRFLSNWGATREGQRFPLSIFVLQETDALTQRAEVFLIVHAPSPAAESLKGLSIRLRDHLKRKLVPSLFRIDPKYGLLSGSTSEPVDPSVKWDRPGCYSAIYLTDDPSSPSIAVMEYVPSIYRRRFQEIFFKYNQVSPATQGLLKMTLKKFLRGAPIEPPRRLTFSLLRTISSFLSEQSVSRPTISLIFKDLPPEEGKRILLDPRLGSYFLAGQDRFVSSLGELA